MKFSDYYVTEGKTDIKAPVKIEEVFVDVINKGHAKSDRKRYEPVVKAVVDKLDLKGSASHIGSDMDGRINTFYMTAIKSLGMEDKHINKRPKTDLIIGRDRVSLKLDRGWIFSHQLNDAQACLEYVIENSDIKDKIKQEVLTTFGKLKDKQSKSLYDLADGKVLRGKLVDRFIEFFENSEYSLKKDFIQAGLRGTFKFEESDKAVADKLLVVKFISKNLSAQTAMADINKIKMNLTNLYDLKTDDSYLDQLAERSRVAFVIRKTGKLRFDINSLKLDGDILAEGVLDTIGDLLKQGYEKVKDKIEKLFSYLVDLISRGIRYFMDILGLSIEVKMENEIEF